MAIAPPNYQKNKRTMLPPRRGQIKAQIFENLRKTMFFIASKAWEMLEFCFYKFTIKSSYITFLIELV